MVFGTAGSDDEDPLETHTTQFLKEADCPVLIVPMNTNGFSLKSIALALDENEIDNAVDLSVFHDMAKWFDASVHLLKVNKIGQQPVTDQLKKQDTLDYYMEGLDYQYSFPESGDIEQGLRGYIRDNKIDALAILPRNHAQRSQPSEGRLTKVLAKHIKVPLLVLD